MFKDTIPHSGRYIGAHFNAWLKITTIINDKDNNMELLLAKFCYS